MNIVKAHATPFLASFALLGSVAVAAPLAHAAPAHPVKVAQLHAVGGQQALPGMLSHSVSPDFSITICIKSVCVTIKF